VPPVRLSSLTYIRGRPLRLTAHDFDVFHAELTRLDDGAAEVPLALAGLVAEQVFLARLAPLQLARSRHAEALLGNLVCLHLWHRTPDRSGPRPCRKKKGAPGEPPGVPGNRSIPGTW